MISNFKEVNTGFYKFVSGLTTLEPKNIISLQDYKGNPIKVTFRSGHTASPDFTQESGEGYPVISVTPFSPVLREGYPYDEKPYYAAARASDSNNPDVIDIATLFPDPIPLVFRYEIAVASKNPIHHERIQAWLISRLEGRFNKGQKHLVINKLLDIDTVFGTDTIGDIVAYSFSHITDPLRSDAIMESLYEVRLFPYVHLVDPIDVPVIQELFVGLFQNS